MIEYRRNSFQLYRHLAKIQSVRVICQRIACLQSVFVTEPNSRQSCAIHQSKDSHVVRSGYLIWNGRIERPLFVVRERHFLGSKQTGRSPFFRVSVFVNAMSGGQEINVATLHFGSESCPGTNKSTLAVFRKKDSSGSILGTSRERSLRISRHPRPG